MSNNPYPEKYANLRWRTLKAIKEMWPGHRIVWEIVSNSKGVIKPVQFVISVDGWIGRFIWSDKDIKGMLKLGLGNENFVISNFINACNHNGAYGLKYIENLECI